MVELKRNWIEPEKAARRIAGHANAARGENILWLIGVDEKDTNIIGANSADMASWYSSVESCFNDLAPRMISLNIPVDGVVVVALLFETNRAPFVVKNPCYGRKDGGSVELEVPWRENTSVRSARRSDIIRLLTPLERIPEVEILSIRLEAILSGERGPGNYYPNNQLIASGDLYIIPKSESRIVIPFHRCRGEFKAPGFELMEASSIKLKAPVDVSGIIASGRKSGTVESTTHEAIIKGPGRLSFIAVVEDPPFFNIESGFEIEILISLKTTGSDQAVILKRTLPCPEEAI